MVELAYEPGGLELEPTFLNSMLYLELGGQNMSPSHELVSDLLFPIWEEKSFSASTEIQPLVKGERKEHGFCVKSTKVLRLALACQGILSKLFNFA